MADMSPHLKPWLTLSELARLDGEFEGVIVSVDTEILRNRFKFNKKTDEAVVTFGDGHRLVLNKSMLYTCIKWWGSESDNWIGHRMRVFTFKAGVAGKTGQPIWQRGLACDEVFARSLTAVAPQKESSDAKSA